MADDVKKYAAKDYSHLKGIKGLTDEVLENHFALYQGYVNRTNALTDRLSTMTKEKKASGADPAYAEMTRRLGWEYNGIILHDLYFCNLTNAGKPLDDGSSFRSAAEKSFAGYENWKADFAAVCTMPGIGWAITYQNPTSGALSNHWIGEHHIGHPAGYTPLLVIDAWEHAFVPAFKPNQRAKYIEAIMEAVDWTAVESRLKR